MRKKKKKKETKGGRRGDLIQNNSERRVHHPAVYINRDIHEKVFARRQRDTNISGISSWVKTCSTFHVNILPVIFANVSIYAISTGYIANKVNT